MFVSVSEDIRLCKLLANAHFQETAEEFQVNSSHLIDRVVYS